MMGKHTEIIPEVATFQFCFNLMQVCFVKFCVEPAILKCSTCKFDHANFRKYRVAALLTISPPLYLLTHLLLRCLY